MPKPKNSNISIKNSLDGLVNNQKFEITPTTDRDYALGLFEDHVQLASPVAVLIRINDNLSSQYFVLTGRNIPKGSLPYLLEQQGLFHERSGAQNDILGLAKNLLEKWSKGNKIL